jgi:cell division septation protein DedD
MPYAVQVAALSDIDNAREIVLRLGASGLPAYLIEPPAGDSLYRVRVGTYPTRAAALKVAADLGGSLGVKVWVMREKP